MASLLTRRRQADADEALIRGVYEEHGRALLTYATRLTNDRAAAEDVVQETLLRAWKHPEVLVNGKGSTRGWLLTVARNIVIDKARARGARPAEVAEQPGRPPIERDHSDRVVNTTVVLGAMDKLSGSHREVLVELYFRGATVTEAAMKLGIPAGTVKSRSHHAIKGLRELLSPGQAVLEGVAE
ncbi:MAG: polymerase [Amycolatopsis sp.]|jgi:RNA polymerase sigma-70 factor (ECF subfamily)|uniref:sigma-70 family RNA polymerase sigma factor n=1 Tax=Amycolatopsis sp. TaxID=37632 RepID=UPI002621F3EA|nr:sigma-70 family RNA polymerase sigma factor [Amycolatopsis sp.]MCU1681433.1 polymerase [Amycolatopsis sp.]